MISSGLQDWDSALTFILQGPVRRALILGPMDAGKSSFALALIQAALERGKSAALIDADLGQKMVGPPAAVTLAWGDAPRSSPSWERPIRPRVPPL